METEEQASKPSFNCILFDLDETLYPLSSGLSAATTESINRYMVEKLNIEETKVHDLCIPLYKQYGTTMAGLRALGYKFDYADYHSFVLGSLPYSNLKPDPVLRNLLLTLPIRKLIFTNADEAHTQRVLTRLGLNDCFEGVICFETLNEKRKGDEEVEADERIRDDSGHHLPKTPVICKPSEEAFNAAFQIAKIDPHKTVFVDDSLRNLQAGKKLGLCTIRVGSSCQDEGVDHALVSIHNIKGALPHLWEGNGKPECINQETVAIETTVRA